MILIIDNYDSFVYNIARYFEELGQAVLVQRSEDLRRPPTNTKALVISPGPCSPREAESSVALIREFSGLVPILGICLGHQCIGDVFGAQVTRAKRPMHGEASEIVHTGRGIFSGLPNRFTAARYHSLIVETDDLNPLLEITARSDDGEIMGLQHRQHPTFGVQFHPESVLTEHGYRLLKNFLEVIK